MIIHNQLYYDCIVPVGVYVHYDSTYHLVALGHIYIFMQVYECSVNLQLKLITQMLWEPTTMLYKSIVTAGVLLMVGDPYHRRVKMN